MNVVRVKDGVQFTVISPAGFEILSALTCAADFLKHDVTITSACDGLHSGPEDPHHTGDAYDVRTHDWANPQDLLDELLENLDRRYFYAFIEAPGTDNEHIHVQKRHGFQYPQQSEEVM